jgi:hypothetical protein
MPQLYELQPAPVGAARLRLPYMSITWPAAPPLPPLYQQHSVSTTIRVQTGLNFKSIVVQLDLACHSAYGPLLSAHHQSCSQPYLLSLTALQPIHLLGAILLCKGLRC